MRYEFHPEAREEFDKAGHYYARQQPGLDLRFIVCIDEAIEFILADPLRRHPFDEDVRRCLTRVFPYGILYTVEADFMLILGRPLQPGTRLLEAPNRLGIVKRGQCPNLHRNLILNPPSPE